MDASNVHLTLECEHERTINISLDLVSIGSLVICQECTTSQRITAIGNFYRADHPKIDSTLTRLNHYELSNLKDCMVQAICDQPAHDDPEFDAEMAYELSVLNWDIANDIAGRVHLFDEWFSGVPA